MIDFVKVIFKKFKNTQKEYNFKTEGSKQVAKYTILAKDEKEAWRKAEELERECFKDDSFVNTELVSENNI